MMKKSKAKSPCIVFKKENLANKKKITKFLLENNIEFIPTPLRSQDYQAVIRIKKPINNKIQAPKNTKSNITQKSTQPPIVNDLWDYLNQEDNIIYEEDPTASESFISNRGRIFNEKSLEKFENIIPQNSIYYREDDIDIDNNHDQISNSNANSSNKNLNISNLEDNDEIDSNFLYDNNNNNNKRSHTYSPIPTSKKDTLKEKNTSNSSRRKINTKDNDINSNSQSKKINFQKKSEDFFVEENSNNQRMLNKGYDSSDILFADNDHNSLKHHELRLDREYQKIIDDFYENESDMYIKQILNSPTKKTLRNKIEPKLCSLLIRDDFFDEILPNYNNSRNYDLDIISELAYRLRNETEEIPNVEYPRDSEKHLTNQQQQQEEQKNCKDYAQNGHDLMNADDDNVKHQKDEFLDEIEYVPVHRSTANFGKVQEKASDTLKDPNSNSQKANSHAEDDFANNINKDPQIIHNINQEKSDNFLPRKSNRNTHKSNNLDSNEGFQDLEEHFVDIDQKLLSKTQSDIKNENSNHINKSNSPSKKKRGKKKSEVSPSKSQKSPLLKDKDLSISSILGDLNSNTNIITLLEGKKPSKSKILKIYHNALIEKFRVLEEKEDKESILIGFRDVLQKLFEEIELENLPPIKQLKYFKFLFKKAKELASYTTQAVNI